MLDSSRVVDNEHVIVIISSLLLRISIVLLLLLIRSLLLLRLAILLPLLLLPRLRRSSLSFSRQLPIRLEFLSVRFEEIFEVLDGLTGYLFESKS